MCGIFGILAENSVASVIYDGLATLQHRGQDAAGILTCAAQKVHQKQGRGLVREIFQAQDLQNLSGNLGLGHVRYPTAGSFAENETQPFFVNSPFGLGLVHNGNLTNTKKLRETLIKREARHLNTNSDSEILLNVFARALRKQYANSLNSRGQQKFSAQLLFAAVTQTYNLLEGGFAVVVLIVGHGLLAFRDPLGLRPLAIGERQGATQKEFAVASEDVALSVLGFTQITDVQPGEAIWLPLRGQAKRKICVQAPKAACLFEYVYLARPDAKLDAVSVYRSRLRSGIALAQQIRQAKVQPDVVVPVPDTARAAAISLAEELGVRYREGLIKNRYISRTFIMPTQSKRQKSIRHKLIPLPLELKDRKVLLVDDSIVRGNTSRQIVELVRQAGAKQVFFAAAAPPLKFPCVYGVDMPSKQEFIAHGLSVTEIQKQLQVDGLFYLRLQELKQACEFKDARNRAFCTACFEGRYPTKVSAKYLQEIQELRAAARQSDECQMPLF